MTSFVLRTFIPLAILGLGCQGHQVPLSKVAEILLPGSANRFDYQSLEENTGRLFLSHMGDGHLVVIDVIHNKVIADLPGYATVTGVLAVPEVGKLFASAAGTHEVVISDLKTLKILARLKGADFPDGVAYAPKERRVFVSDESGEIELVIDAVTNRVLGKVELGGEVGNTRYDAKNHRILVAVQTKNEMAAIDPKTMKLIGKYPLPGSHHPHGFLVDDERGLAYVSCEGNAKLLVVDLGSMKVIQTLPVGSGPDVLAFDLGLRRLYVACESGVVNVFQEAGGKLTDIGAVRAPHSHTVSVDQKTHRVYLALKDVGGKPVLWVMEPTKK